MDEMRYLRRNVRMIEMPFYKKEEGIPTEEELLPVIIRIFREKGELTLEELRELLIEYFWLDDDDINYVRNDENRSLFFRRVYYVVYYWLFRHCLLERVARGTYELSRWGKQISEYYPQISSEEVKRFPVRLREVEDADDIDEVPYPYYREREYGIYREDLYGNDNINISYFDFPMEIDNEPDREEPWFNLSEEDYWELYYKDTRFRNLIRSGRVIFKEGQIVPIKYVLGDGKYSALEMTQIRDERLRVEVRKNFRTNEIYFKGVFRDEEPLTRMAFLTICKKPFDWEDPDTEDIIDRIKRELPYTTVEIFEYLKRVLKIKWESLAKVMGVSTRELQNWRKTDGVSDEPRVAIKLDYLVAICLALQLPPEISEELLKRVDARDENKDPYDPDAAGGVQRVWQTLLRRHYTKSTKEINNLCRKKKIRCLFSENPDDHEDDPKVDHDIDRSDKKI